MPRIDSSPNGKIRFKATSKSGEAVSVDLKKAAKRFDLYDSNFDPKKINPVIDTMADTANHRIDTKINVLTIKTAARQKKIIEKARNTKGSERKKHLPFKVQKKELRM